MEKIVKHVSTLFIMDSTRTKNTFHDKHDHKIQCSWTDLFN